MLHPQAPTAPVQYSTVGMYILMLIYTVLLYCIHVDYLLLANNNKQTKNNNKVSNFPTTDTQSQTIQPTLFSN